MNTLLSICIPTYNREQQLNDNLQHLLPKIKKYEIPIYISDNASIDNTELIVKKWQLEYPFIFYNKNNINLGADLNFEIVLKLPSTKYAWLLSDDDWIDTQYLNEILTILSYQELDLLINNAGDQSGFRVKDIGSKYYTNANDVLYELGWHMDYMSCLIVSNKLIKNCNFEKYKNTSLIQFGIIFDYLSRKNNILIYWNSDKVIVPPGDFYCRNKYDDSKNGGWRGKAFEIFCKNWATVINEFPDCCYTQEAKSNAMMGHGYKTGLFSAKGLIKLSLQGIFTYQVLLKYKKYIDKTIPYSYWKLFLVSLLPHISDNALDRFLNIYRKIKKFKTMVRCG